MNDLNILAGGMPVSQPYGPHPAMQALYPLASIKPSTERTSLRRNLPSGLQTLVDWDWLEAWLAAQEFGPLSSLRLMAGVRGTLLPASYAVRDRILTQASNRQEWRYREDRFSTGIGVPSASPFL